ncbi:hypothetical protein BKA62DRAFT_772443 [Auriculariales sp. MPI-PUGE-AT-0066]|nr:hypothetical protein BKA62DRAFT_772443 [Auriculariales sp. MPI-PUGE-AT-0066]
MSLTTDNDTHSIASTQHAKAQLFSEEHIWPILIGAKAALLDPPKNLGLHLAFPENRKGTLGRGDTAQEAIAVASVNAHWWNVHGKKVLEQLCHELSVPLEALPDAPSREETFILGQSLPTNSEFHLQTALLLLRLSLGATAAEELHEPAEPSVAAITTRLGYTAPTRAFLFHVVDTLGIPRQALREAERQLADQFFNTTHLSSLIQLHAVEQSKAQNDTETLRKKNEHGWGGQWGRWAATGVGVVLGGVAIGVTGGLAAPVLLPLLGPLVPLLGMTAVTAPIVIGSVFGLAGGGLTGYRVRRRWAGVDHFEFVDLSAEPQIAPDPMEVTMSQRAQALWAGASENSTPDSAAAEVHAPTIHRPTVQPEIHAAPSLTATILVPGLQTTSTEESLFFARRAVAHGIFNYPRRDVYLLSHSPEMMLEVGTTLKEWIMTQLFNRARTQVLAMTALGAVMSALALPVGLYMATGTVADNAWVRACDRASKAGHLLAEVLKQRVQGARPVVLVGTSLGSIVVMEALLELAADAEKAEKAARETARGSAAKAGINLQLSKLFQRTPSPSSADESSSVQPAPTNSNRFGKPWQQIRALSTTQKAPPAQDTSLPDGSPALSGQTGMASSFFAKHFTARSAASESTSVASTPEPSMHQPHVATESHPPYFDEPTSSLPLPDEPAKLPLPLVDTAIFISSPLSPSRKEWLKVRRVVARRIVNAYCRNDLVLAVVGRLHEIVGGVQLRDVSGLGPVLAKKKPKQGKEGKEERGVDGASGEDEPAEQIEIEEDEFAIVENIDISDLIEGHFEISTFYEAIMRRVGVAE